MKFKYIPALISVLALICTTTACSTAPSDSSAENGKTDNSASQAESKDNSEESKKNKKAEEASEKESSDEEDTSIPEISDPTPDNMGETVNGLFVYNDVAYELFYGSEGMAKYYSETISGIKKALGDDINVYNVVVPTHVGVDLPDKFNDLCSDEGEYLDTIVKSYTADVKGVNAYNAILRHRNEYLYFNSDHHWTALAAYYAYKEFAKAAGIDAVELTDLKENKIEDYSGSLAYDTGLDTLKEDYVTYYTTDYDIDCTKYDEYAQNPTEYSLIHSYAEGVNAYGVFLGGDTPVLVAKNEHGNGKKIAVIKESYGNAFAPFIAYTYGETHIIDFRYVEFDLKSYLEENGITDVLFVNNAMASATDARCEELSALVGGVSYSAGDDDTDDADGTDDYTDAEDQDYDTGNDDEKYYNYEDYIPDEDETYDDNEEYGYDEGYYDEE